MSPSKIKKFPVRILGGQRCADGFNSGVKGLLRTDAFIDDSFTIKSVTITVKLI
jgi:hypothetical protein